MAKRAYMHVSLLITIVTTVYSRCDKGRDAHVQSPSVFVFGSPLTQASYPSCAAIVRTAVPRQALVYLVGCVNTRVHGSFKRDCCTKDAKL